MKKDKEWLKKGIEVVLYRANLRGTLPAAEGNLIYDDIVSQIDQLDEPEVLSQEWIRNNQERKGVHFFVKVNKLQNLIVPKQEEITESFKETIRELIKTSELAMDVQKLTGMTLEEIKEEARNGGFVPKQELPVIPRFVADWIIRHRDTYDLYPALKKLEDKPAAWKPWKRIYEWYRMNTHQFVNAYLTGEYEVEEQKYYILDPDDIPLLERVGNQIQRTTTELSIYEKGRDNPRFKLTEQEIKNYDERFWTFAEPVEQVDFRLSF